MFAGCSTTGGPNMHSESNPTNFIDEAQASMAAPKATEEYGANAAVGAVGGTLIGAAPGAIGIASLAPACASPLTVGICAAAMPVMWLLTILGGTAGGIVGADVGSAQSHAQ